MQVVFNDVPIEIPREGNQWLMYLFMKAGGFSTEELKRLNLVRIYQQVLFLSCVLGASGKTLMPDISRSAHQKGGGPSSTSTMSSREERLSNVGEGTETDRASRGYRHELPGEVPAQGLQDLAMVI